MSGLSLQENGLANGSSVMVVSVRNYGSCVESVQNRMEDSTEPHGKSQGKGDCKMSGILNDPYHENAFHMAVIIPIK